MTMVLSDDNISFMNFLCFSLCYQHLFISLLSLQFILEKEAP